MGMLFDEDPADLDIEAFGYAAPDETEARADTDRGWLSRILLITTILLAFTNAQSLVTWSSTLEPTWTGRTVRALSQAWADQMSELGLDRFRNGVSDVWTAFQELPRRQGPPRIAPASDQVDQSPSP
ncbi:hypothetical protein Q0812_08545 [Brevundimonas sp. 2R-24]|uniref:Uncharacterized protein n=1 Tax=Peiella sedimenti TaxID=3061083 RepID=A0ABT8SMX4_9CAUL|nr:hypothetical protein [Caulobacteraceae bacterium XZ-24]